MAMTSSSCKVELHLQALVHAQETILLHHLLASWPAIACHAPVMLLLYRFSTGDSRCAALYQEPGWVCNDKPVATTYAFMAWTASG